jgi:hypothetical protein
VTGHGSSASPLVWSPRAIQQSQYQQQAPSSAQSKAIMAANATALEHAKRTNTGNPCNKANHAAANANNNHHSNHPSSPYPAPPSNGATMQSSHNIQNSAASSMTSPMLRIIPAPQSNTPQHLSPATLKDQQSTMTPQKYLNDSDLRSSAAATATPTMATAFGTTVAGTPNSSMPDVDTRASQTRRESLNQQQQPHHHAEHVVIGSGVLLHGAEAEMHKRREAELQQQQQHQNQRDRQPTQNSDEPLLRSDTTSSHEEALKQNKSSIAQYARATPLPIDTQQQQQYQQNYQNAVPLPLPLNSSNRTLQYMTDSGQRNNHYMQQQQLMHNSQQLYKPSMLSRMYSISASRRESRANSQIMTPKNNAGANVGFGENQTTIINYASESNTPHQTSQPQTPAGIDHRQRGTSLSQQNRRAAQLHANVTAAMNRTFVFDQASVNASPRRSAQVDDSHLRNTATTIATTPQIDAAQHPAHSNQLQKPAMDVSQQKHSSHLTHHYVSSNDAVLSGDDLSDSNGAIQSESPLVPPTQHAPPQSISRSPMKQ